MSSTKRAKACGPKLTFLTMHVYLTALLEVITMNNGAVIDIMGDGIMALWPMGNKGDVIGRTVSNVVHGALSCGLDILQVIDEVVNPIIIEECLGDEVAVGVGVDYGETIVTKIGVPGAHDVKAFGDCINNASHFANDDHLNAVLTSSTVRNICRQTGVRDIYFQHRDNLIHKQNNSLEVYEARYRKAIN